MTQNIILNNILHKKYIKIRTKTSIGYAKENDREKRERKVEGEI